MPEGSDLIAKTIGESIEPLAEASGVLGPVKELSEWVSSFIHYRRMPFLAKQVHRAAEKIRSKRLPPAAVSDKLLRALLEGGSMEDDGSMQERWANLLANAATESAAEVHPAFPEILRQMQPDEAAILDALAEAAIQDGARAFVRINNVIEASRENLKRLGLVEVTTYTEDVNPAFAPGGFTQTSIRVTDLGLAFVIACREPLPAD
jgi:hypothetical protein